MNNNADLKKAVAGFWNEKSCGEVYGIGTSERDYYESNSKARYELESYILILRGSLKPSKRCHRVLRPGGSARIMIYAEHLESPGTKAYSIAEARAMFAMFSNADVRIQLNFGDLLRGAVGQRHRGLLLTAAKHVWPRWLIRRVCKNHGLGLLIEATK